VMLDADGSTPPEEIESLLKRLLAGYDLAKGSRFLKGGSSQDITFVRRLGNSFLLSLVRLLLGGSYTDLCYGFAAFWRDVLPAFQLDLQPDYFGFEVETLIGIRAIQNRLRVAEIPSVEMKRIQGASRLRVLRDGWRILKLILSEWSAPSKSHMPAAISCAPVSDFPVSSPEAGA